MAILIEFIDLVRAGWHAEHVLLALGQEGSGVAANVLKNLDLDLLKLRGEVGRRIPGPPGLPGQPGLPSTGNDAAAERARPAVQPGGRLLPKRPARRLELQF